MEPFFINPDCMDGIFLNIVLEEMVSAIMAYGLFLIIMMILKVLRH